MVIQYKLTKQGINRLTHRTKDDDLSSVHEEVRAVTNIEYASCKIAHNNI
jgi:hypothetical protein